MKLTKETLKRIIKEELEAALNEGDRRFRSKYDKNPLKDMGWEHSGKTSTITPGDPTEAQESISNILMIDAGLRISRAAMATKEITDKIHDEGFDLTDYLISTIGIPTAQSSEIAEKIMKEISQ